MYDLTIIGSGPAGYSAAIYAARYKLNTIIVGAVSGGTMAEAHLVENWPGINSITGVELTKNFEEHVRHFEVAIEKEQVKEIVKNDKFFITKTENGKTFESKAVIIAAGTKKRKLGIPGELELKGKGVSYCATCDAFFFKNKTAAVIGGSDSAGTAALLLADHAEKVYIIYHKEPLRCEEITFERIKNNGKIEIIYNTSVVKINPPAGGQKVESIELSNEFKGSRKLELDGVFIEIGAAPSADLARNLGAELDNLERIKINQDCSTNVDGVFAAGDVTVGLYDLRQIITAAASGAIAATSANKFVKIK
ncbi:MAG: FAD-dependent oxidoreductase [bacterium]